MSTPAADQRAVKSADRTLHILEALGRAARPLAVVELHRITGYPRSSLHQLLHTLAANRWIDMSEDGTQVSIGAQALVVGTSYLDRDRAIPFAAPVLEEIRDETGFTTHYARLEGDSVLYLATREPSNSHRRASRIGRKLPAYCTALGKALLAQLTPDERAAVTGDGELAALTPQTVTDRAELDDQLAAARRRGYSTERGESTPDVVCVAAPVQYRIPATDAISCSMPAAVATEEEIARVGGIVSLHAARLASELQANGVR
ncbi:IclR family transcriptional regulator domain-containing protein [Microbacterium excoecariae]|uniref:IclR family transcriptional regulator domain-containing protein n=1 Tax=Microbacterium excoecariae TaxID=2715210 RepID=UPI00140C4D83